MPYQSKKQRAYMHIHHPKIAAKWDKKYGGKVKKKIAKKGRTVAPSGRKKVSSSKDRFHTGRSASPGARHKVIRKAKGKTARHKTIKKAARRY